MVPSPRAIWQKMHSLIKRSIHHKDVTPKQSEHMNRWRQKLIQYLWPLTLVPLVSIALLVHHLLSISLVPIVKETQERTSLRLLTWNVGKIYLLWDSRVSDGDLQHIAAVIQEINPHLAALQEFRDQAQLNRLMALLSKEWRGAITEDQYDRRAVLLSRLPSRFFPLPSSTGREAQAAIIDFHPGLQIGVVSLHLDAFDANRRLLQAEEFYAGVLRLGENRFIMAGDFNMDPTITSQNSIDQQLYQFLTREMVDAAAQSGATSLISRRLDYVFYRGLNVKRASEYVIRDKRINMMDHDPVVVELVLQAHVTSEEN